MRTTLDLDDDLVDTLLARHPEMSKTQALEAAVVYYLAHESASRLRELAGSLEMEDVSAEARRADRTT